jgi:hypothetical protein
MIKVYAMMAKNHYIRFIDNEFYLIVYLVYHSDTPPVC